MKTENSKSKILVICGPTGSGKTALALKLAGDKPTSIISADSRQIYQGLDIVTGKDIPEGFAKVNNYYEKNNLRLWGLDLLKPDQVYNAADFSNLSRKIIEKELSEGRNVFVVGGTGFYLKSLIQPNSISNIPPNQLLRQELEKLSLEQLQHKLQLCDPARYTSMNHSDQNNPRRLIRALEIAQHPQPISSPSHYEGEGWDGVCSWLGIKIPLEDLQKKIETRVRYRLDHGAINEVEKLLEKYPDQNLPVYTTLGVRPIIRFITKEIDFDTLVNTWVTDEMNYVKRQLTWFKKQPEIVWYTGTHERQES